MNMNRSLLLAIGLFLGSGYAALGQGHELLLGKWVYSEPVGKAKMDDKTAKMMDTVFSDWYFDFGAEGDYKAIGMGKEEHGSWEMNAAGTLISLVNDKGIKSEITVIELTHERWVMEIDEGKGFVMVRVDGKKE